MTLWETPPITRYRLAHLVTKGTGLMGWATTRRRYEVDNSMDISSSIAALPSDTVGRLVRKRHGKVTVSDLAGSTPRGSANDGGVPRKPFMEGEDEPTPRPEVLSPDPRLP